MYIFMYRIRDAGKLHLRHISFNRTNQKGKPQYLILLGNRLQSLPLSHKLLKMDFAVFYLRL